MAFNEANFLDEPVPGLGLASSPGTELLIGDAGVAESVGLRPSSSGFLGPAGASAMPSLGLAAPMPREQSEKEYLENLPMREKVGLALESFGAGVLGKPSPIDQLLKERRARQAADRADLANTINIISKGTEILRKMPPGIARDAVAAELGRAVGGGQIAEVFKVAGDQHQEVKDVLSTFSDQDVQQQLLKAYSGSGDFRAYVVKQANNKDFMDRAHSMADAKRMPAIVAKLGPAMDQVKKSGVLEEFKGADGKYEVPLAKLIELNEKAKIFTPEEMATIRRDEDMLSPFGLKTIAALKAGAAERAKQAERPTKDWSEPYTLNGALVQKNLATGEIRTAVSRPPRGASEEMTAAQKARLAKEITAYGNAQAQMQKFGLSPDGSSTKPEVQKRLAPKRPMNPNKPAGPANPMYANPDYDPVFAGRVKAWLKITEAGDPHERAGETTAKPKEAAQAPAPAEKPATIYKSAEDVRAAFKAGRIDRATAKRELRKFGYQ